MPLQVHVSKPQDPEFRGMVGGLGVYGVITELLMQMTPLSYTTLTTVQMQDKNLFKDVNNMLKVGAKGSMCAYVCRLCATRAPCCLST